MTLLTIKIEINIATDDKSHFKDLIHVMPWWRVTVPVTVKYLINIDAPVSKWKIHYTTVTPDSTNHALTECSHPKLGDLAIWSNFHAATQLWCRAVHHEWFVWLRSKLFYQSPTGTLVSSALPAYIIVDFSRCFIRGHQKLFYDKSHSWASIHMAKFKREI